MSETCVLPLHFGAGGLHGRKDSYHIRLGRPTVRGCTCVPCFFCAQPERGTENRTDLTPNIMLRPNTHQNRYNSILYSADRRSVREGMPSSAAYETPQQKLYKRQADKDWYRLPPLHTAVQRSSATGDGKSAVACHSGRAGKHPPDR